MHFFPLEHEHTLTDREFEGCCRACERSFRMVYHRLCDFYNTIIGYSLEDLYRLSPPEIFNLYLIIDDIAHLKCHHDLDKRILANAEIQRMLPAIRHYYKTFFDIHESFLVNEVIKAEDPWMPLVDFGLYPRYETLIRTQVESLQNERPQRVVFIGSGPMPISLILLYRLYGIESVGIDIDQRAVSLSTQGLRRLGLEGPITVVQGTEKALSHMDWDLVVVAALAEPKVRIFTHLRKIMAEGGRRPVICRTYSGLRTLLHPPLEQGDYPGFRICKEIRPEKNRVNNTLLQLEMVG